MKHRRPQTSRGQKQAPSYRDKGSGKRIAWLSAFICVISAGLMGWDHYMTPPAQPKVNPRTLKPVAMASADEAVTVTLVEAKSIPEAAVAERPPSQAPISSSPQAIPGSASAKLGRPIPRDTLHPEMQFGHNGTNDEAKEQESGLGDAAFDPRLPPPPPPLIPASAFAHRPTAVTKVSRRTSGPGAASNTASRHIPSRNQHAIRAGGQLRLIRSKKQPAKPAMAKRPTSDNTLIVGTGKTTFHTVNAKPVN